MYSFNFYKLIEFFIYSSSLNKTEHKKPAKVERPTKLLSDKCETILVQQTVEIGSNIHLRILHILFISLLMLRESELVYISNGPHVNTAETLSRIVKVLQQFLGLGIKGRNYLINEIVYWSKNKETSMKLFTNINL